MIPFHLALFHDAPCQGGDLGLALLWLVSAEHGQITRQGCSGHRRVLEEGLPSRITEVIHLVRIEMQVMGAAIEDGSGQGLEQDGRTVPRQIVAKNPLLARQNGQKGGQVERRIIGVLFGPWVFDPLCLSHFNDGPERQRPLENVHVQRGRDHTFELSHVAQYNRVHRGKQSFVANLMLSIRQDNVVQACAWVPPVSFSVHGITPIREPLLRRLGATSKCPVK